MQTIINTGQIQNLQSPIYSKISQTILSDYVIADIDEILTFEITPKLFIVLYVNRIEVFKINSSINKYCYLKTITGTFTSTTSMFINNEHDEIIIFQSDSITIYCVNQVDNIDNSIATRSINTHVGIIGITQHIDGIAVLYADQIEVFRFDYLKTILENAITISANSIISIHSNINTQNITVLQSDNKTIDTYTDPKNDTSKSTYVNVDIISNLAVSSNLIAVDSNSKLTTYLLQNSTYSIQSELDLTFNITNLQFYDTRILITDDTSTYAYTSNFVNLFTLDTIHSKIVRCINDVVTIAHIENNAIVDRLTSHYIGGLDELHIANNITNPKPILANSDITEYVTIGNNIIFFSNTNMYTFNHKLECIATNTIPTHTIKRVIEVDLILFDNVIYSIGSKLTSICTFSNAFTTNAIEVYVSKVETIYYIIFEYDVSESIQFAVCKVNYINPKLELLGIVNRVSNVADMDNIKTRIDDDLLNSIILTTDPIILNSSVNFDNLDSEFTIDGGNLIANETVVNTFGSNMISYENDIIYADVMSNSRIDIEFNEVGDTITFNIEPITNNKFDIYVLINNQNAVINVDGLSVQYVVNNMPKFNKITIQATDNSEFKLYITKG